MTDSQRALSEDPDVRTATTEAPAIDKPVSELIGDMTAEVTALLRKELELAVVELKGEARQAAKAGGMLGGGALSGYLSLLFASFGVAWFLDRKLPRPLAFFVVAGLHGATAATLFARGREEMMAVDPVPQQTVDTVKESVEWAKAQAG